MTGGSLMTFGLIAHRGASEDAPEATIASFDLALASGFGHIELDAQLTADVVPVVVHDDAFDRTTDGSGPVAEATLAQVKELDAGSWFENAAELGYIGLRVPTLDEVLQRYAGRAHVYIELKSEQPRLPRAVAGLVERHGWLKAASGDPEAVPGLTVISFHLEQLGRSQVFMPEVRHGWLVWALDSVDTRLAGRMGLRSLYPYVGAVTPQAVEEARSAGLVVGVWGIRSLGDLARAVEVGASGATVDWPAAALDFLRGMKLDR